MSIKKYFNRSLIGEEKIELVGKFKDKYKFNRVINILSLTKSTWHYTQSKQRYEENRSFERATDGNRQRPSRIRLQAYYI